MPRRFKEARVMNHMKAVEAAEKLGVATPTLSAWESEKKSPPIEMILAMAELYNVSTDYLLGNDVQAAIDSLSDIPQASLSLYHGRPVWVKDNGWALVNSIEKVLTFPDGHKELYTDATILARAPRFAEIELPTSIALTKEEIKNSDSVWVEPLSADKVREELRGCYTVRGEYVENSRGNRFFLDSYAATWFAFEISTQKGVV